MSQQLSLFEHVKSVYADTTGPIDNQTLYRRVAERAGVSEADFRERQPIGDAGSHRSVCERQVRWHQQTMRAAGWLEKAPGKRGCWALTGKGKKALHTAKPGLSLIAFSTKLGIAVWGNCIDVLKNLDTPITVAITSPPYPLRNARAYGNPEEKDYVDFICAALEPIMRHLRDGGLIALNVGADCFEPGLPSRSLYRERLILALHDRLGLHKLDELIWHIPNKAPGPVMWASLSRQQLNSGYEPVYILTNNPRAALSDNRRVLEPHTARHAALIAKGGETRKGTYSDGAYRIAPGDYSNPTAGRIPRNVLPISNYCGSQREYKAAARELGLPAHGAPFPLDLATFLVKFLSDVDDLVVDPFGGSLTTPLAAEMLGRRWISCDTAWEYLRGSYERFRNCAEALLNPDFATALS